MKMKNKSSKAKFVPLLQAFSKMNKDQLSHAIDCLNDDSIDTLCECVYNVIYTDLNLSSKKKTALKKHIKKNCCIHKIKKITTKAYPIIKRRQLLKQEGAGLPMLLMTAVPFLIDLVKSAFSK